MYLPVLVLYLSNERVTRLGSLINGYFGMIINILLSLWFHSSPNYVTLSEENTISIRSVISNKVKSGRQSQYSSRVFLSPYAA